MRLLYKRDFMENQEVSGATPNGDPLLGGRPRTDSNGFGMISDVCIKRKLRDRLSEMGENILVTSQHSGDDSIAKRIASLRGLDYSVLHEQACSHWYDVRAFGQVFAFKGAHSRFQDVRGAVTIQHCFSLHPVEIVELPLTRCINMSTEKRRSSDTLGSKSFVRYGLYVLKGSINTHYAAKNGFSDIDAEKLKAALISLFQNDASAARPEGSMILERLYWWKHSTAYGDYPSHMVFDSVMPKLREGVEKPLSFSDYEIFEQPLKGLSPEIFVFGRPLDVIV